MDRFCVWIWRICRWGKGFGSWKHFWFRILVWPILCEQALVARRWRVKEAELRKKWIGSQLFNSSTFICWYLLIEIIQNVVSFEQISHIVLCWIRCYIPPFCLLWVEHKPTWEILLKLRLRNIVLNWNSALRPFDNLCRQHTSDFHPLFDCHDPLK